MKKGRIVAIALYIFVAQFVIVGLLWDKPTFYWLALINLGVFLIGGITMFLTKKNKTSTIRFIPMFDAIGHGVYRFCRKYFFVLSLFLFLLAIMDHLFWQVLPFSYLWIGVVFLFVGILVFQDIVEKKVYFGKRIFFPKDVIFWTSVIVVFRFSLVFQELFVGYRFLISLMIGFILFILFIRSFKVIGVFSFWKLRGTKLYILGLSIFGLLSIYQFLANNFGQIAHTGGLVLHNIQQGVDWTYDKAQQGLDYLTPVQTGEAQEVLLTGVGAIVETEVAENTQEQVEDIEQAVESEEQDIQEILFEGSDEPLNFMDTIIYLLETNDIELNTKKDMRFRYVSYANPNYAFFRTAYDMKLIGTTLNPEKRVLCDTYLVMKGLVQGRDVGRYTNIKDAYWSYAQKNDVLNGCQRDEFVTERNL